MRVFAVLAFTVASVAAFSGCASNCTQNILNSCTPRFQFELPKAGGGTACFLLDLAPPSVRLFQSDDSTCGDLADFDGEVVASTTNYTIVDNTLTLTTAGTPCQDGLISRAAEIVLTFVYSGSKQAPTICGDLCLGTQKLKVYTDAEECESQAPNDNDNDVESTWGGNSGSSGRRNSASGRRNSASSRRNSASSNGNDGTRRSGCAEVAMYQINRTKTCQLGQCCGSNFCRRDYGVGDCWAANSAAQWLVGHQCEDETCNPNQGDQPGAGSGKGGAIVIIHSSLDNAVGALPERGRLVVATKSVEGEIPAFGNEILIAFDVERQFDNETLISGYLPNGGFIIVTVEVDFLNGQEITVFRWDEATSTYVDTLEDCKENGAGDKEITYADGVYSVPICHTSSFIVAFGADGKDKKDHKHDKATKNTKKTKPAKVPTAGKVTLKAPKDTKKEGKKGGKTAIAIGVGVAGGAVALVGAGVFLKSRRNKNKKPTAGAAPKATAEVAVVSV